jgi:hypothetical protein
VAFAGGDAHFGSAEGKHSTREVDFLLNIYTALAGAWLLCLSTSPLLAQHPEVTTPAINDVPAGSPVGERPYEMVWANRMEPREPLVDFEDLGGWQVRTFGGAVAELRRTREQQMFGQYVARLTYRATEGVAGPRVVVAPAEPIPIAEPFDCFEMWIYGNNWAWVSDPSTPQVAISIILRDGTGEDHTIGLTNVRWEEWWLAHHRITPETLAAMPAPRQFVGIEVTGGTNREDRAIFFDSLSFYQEQLAPLSFEPRPARNVQPFPGQTHGLNGAGPGRLPFPTREETILPTNFEKRFTTRVEATGEKTFRFAYEGEDCQVTYDFDAAAGLGSVRASVDGQPVCRPLDGARVTFATDDDAPLRLRDARLEGDVVVLEYRSRDRKIEHRLRIWQKSLVVDTFCLGGEATGLSFGQVAEVENPRLIQVPYITYGGSIPKVLLSGPPEAPRFTSIWFDWYRSNASSPWASPSTSETTAHINGGMTYTPRTDGKRNDLFERIFVTVSPIYEEILPTVDNPASPWGKEAGSRLWQESWGPENYENEMKRGRMLRSYGIDMLTQCNHEIAWRDGGESFTLRTRAAPKRGGDEALIKYIAHQKSLGWRAGLYTNYTDFAPVNEHWDPDYVAREPNWEWRPAWARCYNLKPSRAVELDARLAPQIQAKFGSNAAYTDVHTAVPPWGYCDYDARVPGAGTFAATFYAYGELLLNDQKVYGPTWSEGTYQWLYAGLASGNYGLCYGWGPFDTAPLDVAFDLHKIHPLECDIGMPWTGGFFTQQGWDAPERLDVSIDHFIAATAAYGHIGWLVEESYGIARTCRSYYMLQQLQTRYAQVRPRLIEYADSGGNSMTASQAHATGAIRLSRLHVVYENGLELFVNGSDEAWQIVGAGKQQITLPPWGYHAFDAQTDFVETSALVDGRRVDAVHSPAYDYIDGRGYPAEGVGLAAKGSVALKRRDDGTLQIIDIHDNDEIGFASERDGRLTAYDPDGKRMGPVSTRRSRGMLWFTVRPKARWYIFEPREAEAAAGPEVVLAFGETSIVPGCTVEGRLDVRAPNGQQWSVRSVSLELDGERLPQPPGPVVRVTAPADAQPGKRLWLHAALILEREGRTLKREAWCDLLVVPAAEITLRPRQAGMLDTAASATVTVRNNVPGRPMGTVTFAVSDGFRVEPAMAELPAGQESVEVLMRVEPEGDQERQGEVRITVDVGGASATKAVPVAARTVRPVLLDLADPETKFRWTIATRGSGERPGDRSTGATFFSGRNIESGQITKRGLFSHPPYEGGVGYTAATFEPLQLPADPCELHLFIGLMDGGDPSDGVDFTALVLAPDGGETVLFKENWAKREWREVTADLSAFAGKTIRLKLIADVGPNDNSRADWASWGEPTVRLKRTVCRAEL